ncbi:MFS transporter [Salinarimonas ramus]|uniref:MFS transporter n=1 Tax=Salinarimonas ramus TaxID=690164 RepID=A0A917V5C1_9HYPH|nr:MFS transporter [Salinarimonas ramus]GGK38847.1 MFS transporter [Salinarimonas ramus]
MSLLIRARGASAPRAGDATTALVLALAGFIVNFDITAVVVAMPAIRADLGLDVSGFAWVMDAYSLAFVVLLSSAGALADRYGRRRVLLAGNLVFALASLACGLATDAVTLYAARAAQGVGSAFVICGCLALLSERFHEPATRGRAFALLGTVTGLAVATGPAGGGLIAEYLGWRWVFLINIPICLFIALAVPRVAAESRNPAARSIDYAGVVALSLALTSFVWFLLHGTEIAGVTIPVALAVAIVLGACVAFVLTQILGSEPMLELSLMRDPAFLGICLVPVALSIGYWSILVYLPLFLEEGAGLSRAAISWLMLAATLPMLLLPFLGARLLVATGARTFFAAGLAIVAFGCLVLAWAAAAQGSMALALTGMLACGAAAAALNTQVSSVIMTFAPRERAGMVSAIATILRQSSFAAGIALLGASLARSGDATTLADPSRFVALFLVAGTTTLVGAAAVAILLPRAGGEKEVERGGA